MIRLLVCGGRDFIDERKVFATLHEYKGKVSVLIHGGALGADTIAGTWALINNIPVLKFKADWDRFGRAAGPKRNTQMLVEGKPTLVIAFPGGPGTANMISQSLKANVEIIQIPE